MLIATDCTFLPQSGKKTYDLDLFRNESASRNETGFELSVIALIDQKTTVLSINN